MGGVGIWGRLVVFIFWICSYIVFVFVFDFVVLVLCVLVIVFEVDEVSVL